MLASQLDDYTKESKSKIGLSDLLKFKETKSFQEFFEVVKSGKERDIALVFLHQLLAGNNELQEKVQEHTVVPLHGFRSMNDALVWIDDIVRNGALQERKTTVCVIGNTSAGKSSLVRTLEKYCKDTKAKPKAVLTGDSENKSLEKTKVMELFKDMEFEARSGLNLEVKANRRKFSLICQSNLNPSDQNMTSEEIKERENNVQMSFFDFGGHSEYVSCSTLFMKKKGIFLICFDVNKLVQVANPIASVYHSAIGTYFEIVTEKCLTPIFFLIATKMDEVKNRSDEVKRVLDEFLAAAREHLCSISKRSQRLEAVFLFDEIIKSSLRDEDQLGDALENLGSKLVAVCDHKELMDVRPKTIPTVWKDMIENLRQYLQVDIQKVEEEYEKMLASNSQHLDQIKQLEEEHSMSESNQQLALERENIANWAKMMRDHQTSQKQEEGPQKAGQGDAEGSGDVWRALLDLELDLEMSEGSAADPRREEIKRDGTRVKPGKKEQKKIKEKPLKKIKEKPLKKTRNKKGSRDVVQTSPETKSKVETILRAFSADHDIFWFRWFLISPNLPCVYALINRGHILVTFLNSGTSLFQNQ